MNNYPGRSENNPLAMSQVKVKAVAATATKPESTNAAAWLLKVSLFLIVAGLTAITFLLHSCISGAGI